MKTFRKLSCFFLIILVMAYNTPLTSYGASLNIVSIKNISITLRQYQKYPLPKTVKAKMSNETEKDVAVVWNKNSVNTSNAGTFIIKGTVKGYTPKIVLRIKVIDKDKTSMLDIKKALLFYINASNDSNLSMLGGASIGADELVKRLGLEMSISSKSITMTGNIGGAATNVTVSAAPEPTDVSNADFGPYLDESERQLLPQNGTGLHWQIVVNSKTIEINISESVNTTNTLTILQPSEDQN